MRWLVVFALCSGCQLVFHLELDPDAPPPPIDAPENTNCSNIRMLADDFKGPVEANWVTAENTAAQTVQIKNEALSMTSNANGIGSLTSRYFYDLREDAFTFDVTLVNPIPQAATFELKASARVLFGGFLEEVTMGIQTGTSGTELYGNHTSGGTTFAKFTIPFDPVRDKIWRFARRGDDLIWSTGPSPTGPFTEHGTEPLPQFDFVRIQAVMSSFTTEPISITLDDAVGGTPSGVACAAGGLHDAFPAGPIDPRWANSQANMCMITASDGLTFQPQDPLYGCQLASATIYDLRENALAIELTGVTLGQPVDFAMFPVELHHSFGFSIHPDGMLTAVSFEPFAVYNSKAYSPTAHRWLRISAAAGRVAWDVSSDGVMFAPFANTLDFGTSIDRGAFSVSLAGNGTTPVNPITILHIN